MTAMKKMKAAYESVYVRGTTAMIGLMCANSAMAITTTDLTEDQSGGQTFSDVADRVDQTAQEGASLLIQLVTVFGFVVVAISLYGLYKASKDEREKPMAAILGLFIGGLMAAVGSVMWIMRNTLVV